MNTEAKPIDRKIIFLIVVAALGYFVDIYDLVLFGVVKAESLAAIMPEATNELRASTGKFLFNVQMFATPFGGALFTICSF